MPMLKRKLMQKLLRELLLTRRKQRLKLKKKLKERNNSKLIQLQEKKNMQKLWPLLKLLLPLLQKSMQPLPEESYLRLLRRLSKKQLRHKLLLLLLHNKKKLLFFQLNKRPSMKLIRELKKQLWQKLRDFKKLKIGEELLLRKLKSNK